MATLNGPFPSARDGGNRGVPRDRLAGEAVSLKMIQGMEGVLQSSAAAIQEVRAAAREMALVADRQARMSSTVESVIGLNALGTTQILRILNDSAVGKSPGALLQQISGAAAMSQGMAPGMNLPVNMGPALGPQDTPDRPGGPPSPSRGIPQPMDPEAAASNYERLHSARGYNVRALRQDASRWIGSKVSGAQIGPNLRQAANRRGWEVFDPATHESLGPATHSQIRNMNIANRVRAIGGTVAEQGFGAGLANALPKGVIGPAAFAVGGLMVANQAAQFAEAQREGSAQYQRVLGGSNLEGLRERGSQALFSLGQRGVMSDRQSAQLYEGVTGLGITGRDRQDALDFAVENWKRFGMEVNQSIELMRVNSVNGIRSLTGMAEALDSVTQAARGAGGNADVARQRFTQAYSAAAPNMLGEGSAAAAAGAFTSAFSGLGPAFEDTDVTGLMSARSMRMVGARQGLSQAQMMAQTSGIQGGQNFVRMSQAALIDIANRLLGTQGKQMISEFKRQRGITAPLSKDQADVLAQEMYAANLIQPQQIISSLAPYGINLAPNEALTFLITVLDGGFNPEAQMQDQIDASTRTKLSQSQRNSFATSDRTSGVSTMGEVINAIGGDMSLDTFTDADFLDPNTGELRKGETRLTGSTSGMFGRQDINTARNLYAEQVKNGGEYSPIIGGMLKQGNFDQRFKINVGTEAKPEWREMNMWDAIKHHSDQLARGDVEITEGEGEGRRLAEVLGLNPDEGVEVEYNQEGKKAGRAYDPNKASSGGVSGQVEIYASPELSRLLRFRSMGDATMVTEPPAGRGSNAALPTGYSGW